MKVKKFKLNKKLFESFVYFSQRQYDCLDYDPFHPIFREASSKLDIEQALWLTTLFMAYYNDGSAWLAFHNSDPWKNLSSKVSKLPIGIQRRNLYGGRLSIYFKRLNKQVKEAGSAYNLVTRDFVGDEKKDWGQIQINLKEVWGNGRWSVFTLAEMYQKVNSIPVLPCNLMNDNSSGPARGLQILLGQSTQEVKRERIEELDRKADFLFSLMKKRIKTKIPYLKKGHYDYAMMESQLCDFQSLLKGRYYIGRDIDRGQELIHKATEVGSSLGMDTKVVKKLWTIRAKVFKKAYLGEKQGWDGRTKEALTFYKQTSKICSHKEIKTLTGN